MQPQVASNSLVVFGKVEFVSFLRRGFADSKVLKAEVRESLLSDIESDPSIGIHWNSTSAAIISKKMLQRYVIAELI